jgi:hypothetical protein
MIRSLVLDIVYQLTFNIEHIMPQEQLANSNDLVGIMYNTHRFPLILN